MIRRDQEHPTAKSKPDQHALDTTNTVQLTTARMNKCRTSRLRLLAAVPHDLGYSEVRAKSLCQLSIRAGAQSCPRFKPVSKDEVTTPNAVKLHCSLTVLPPLFEVRAKISWLSTSLSYSSSSSSCPSHRQR